MSSILFVDDEIPVLHSLARAFFDADYVIITADSAAKALRLMETQEIDIVVSDIRMPVMDGYAFLSQVKQKYPKTLRVMMSAYCDEQDTIRALTGNIVKHYILKPWSNDELLSCIDRLVATQRMLNSPELLKLFNGIDEFPTISESYHRIQALIYENASIKRIANEIEKDFAISTKLLHIVNSAFFGVKTGSIHQAAKVLGLQNISSVLRTTVVMNTIGFFRIAKPDYEMLWTHALATNTILSFIYKTFLHKKLPETAMTAGLLHNIGFFALAQLVSSEVMNLTRQHNPEDKNLLVLEKQYLSLTHQEVGGYLLSWWDLPFPIVESALFHHQPFEPSIVNTELVKAVHIAQNYAWEAVQRQSVTPFFAEAFEALGINKEEFEARFMDVNLLNG
jgi:HD-like signal output (HDOD) protein